MVDVHKDGTLLVWSLSSSKFQFSHLRHEWSVVILLLSKLEYAAIAYCLAKDIHGISAKEVLAVIIAVWRGWEWRQVHLSLTAAVSSAYDILANDGFWSILSAWLMIRFLLAWLLPLSCYLPGRHFPEADVGSLFSNFCNRGCPRMLGTPITNQGLKYWHGYTWKGLKSPLLL